jgi:2-methylcitrate dehydratase PrpD
LFSASPSGATWRLAEFSSTLRYEAIPESTVGKIKQLLLDAIGVALAATTLGPGCGVAVSLARRLGGPQESTVLGHGFKVAAPHAAFANGALVHALNYDPIGQRVGHVGVACLAAPLAAAEAVGKISGRRFIAAVGAAAEVAARISAATRASSAGATDDPKFLSGQLLSVFGAAAGAGNVLGLTPKEMRSAFGLSLMQASGSLQLLLAGDPPAKAIYGAFPSQSGMIAALLAKAGLDAACDALEGHAGLFAMFYRGQYMAELIDNGLGSEFLLDEAQCKQWPASREIYGIIEAAIAIGQHHRDPSTIDNVQVTAPSRLRRWAEPIDIRRKPANAVVAANSIPYVVAKALCRGTMSLGDLTPDGLNEPVALGVTQKINCVFQDGNEETVVAVRTMDGKVRTAEVRPGEGGPTIDGRPAAALEKFKDCCRYSFNTLSAAQIDVIAGMIKHIEGVDDIRALTSAIRGAV